MKNYAVKVNFLNLIKYLLVVTAMILLFMFNHRKALFICAFAVILMAVPSILLLIKSFNKPVISLAMKYETQNIGEKNFLITKIAGNGFMTFPRIHIYYNIYHNHEKAIRSFQNVYSFFYDSVEYSEGIYFDYCGVYYISVEKVHIYDWLKIVYLEIKDEICTSTVIMPNTIEIGSVVDKISSKDEEYLVDDPLAGVDVSQIKELRDYREGDKLSQVHWKLSTKSEDLIVKEYDKTAGLGIVIGVDGSYDSLRTMNDYYNYLYTLSLRLIEDEMSFELVYFDNEASDIVRKLINNSYDLEITIQNMFYQLKPVSMYELEAYASKTNNKARLAFVTTQDADPVLYNMISKNNNVKLFIQIYSE